MPPTTYLTAASVDGFIATEDHDLSWLLSMPGGDDAANPYGSFITGVGAMAMGAHTYEWVLAHDEGPWSYRQPCWVFTHRELPRTQGGDIRFTQAPAPQVHAEMAAAAGDRGVWLVGGGDLVGQFLDHDLLDEIVVSVAPVLLGRGAPLLPRRRTVPMRLLSATPSPAGTFVHLHYSLR